MILADIQVSDRCPLPAQCMLTPRDCARVSVLQRARSVRNCGSRRSARATSAARPSPSSSHCTCPNGCVFHGPPCHCVAARKMCNTPPACVGSARPFPHGMPQQQVMVLATAGNNGKDTNTRTHEHVHQPTHRGERIPLSLGFRSHILAMQQHARVQRPELRINSHSHACVSCCELTHTYTSTHT